MINSMQQFQEKGVKHLTEIFVSIKKSKKSLLTRF